MKSVFPKWVLDNINDSIENKKDFSYGISGTRRDRRVSISIGEDGNLRAWYSSEYAGCGNGAYYLLINSKTAIFAEFD